MSLWVQIYLGNVWLILQKPELYYSFQLLSAELLCNEMPQIKKKTQWFAIGEQHFMIFDQDWYGNSHSRFLTPNQFEKDLIL